ncbi:MAG: hypothetical protein LBM60_00490, partial [Clostridium sp.]|nr:hypothetical protein [Clostridium sp.]
MKKVQEMRVSKRFIQYTMGFLLGIALLCGCGKKEENYQLAKDQVFRFESLPYKITESEIVDNVQRNRYVTKLDYLNNKIYLLINVGEYPVYDDGSGGGVQPLKDGGSFIGIEDLYIEDASVQDISSEDPSSEDPSAEDPSAEDPEAEDPEDKKLQEDIIEPVLPPDFAQPRDYYELVTLDADGSNTQVVELESLNDITNGQYAYMSATDFDSSGDLYATLTYSAPDKNNTEIWTEYTTLCKFNHQDGSLLWSKEVEGLTPDYEKGEYFYLTSMTCLDDGSIGLIFDGSERFIMYFDNQGN